MGNEDLRSAIDTAIEAREDGDYEESVEQLATLHVRYADNVEIVLEYSRSLSRVRRHADADAVLSRAVQQHPADAALCRAWSQAPTQVNDFGEVIRRAEILRARFANDADAAEWSSLCVEFDALYESAQWSRLSERLDAYWELVRRQPVVLPAALVAAGKLFQPMRMQLLCQAAEPQAWANLPPDTRANLALQTAIAVDNRKLARRSGYRIVSLGQNCLPYQLLGRWGLSATTAAPEDLTPFDLGGFTGDHAAAAVAGGFSFLEQQDAYSVVPAWGGGEMLSHRPTGIGFFHERGPYWIGNRERFFDRIRSLVAGWNDVLATGRRIFVFCLCGAGDPARLVSTVVDTLLGDEDYLVVLDVLAEPHTVPRHPRVLYRHCPYPRNYDWTDFGQQVSNRGLEFELKAIEPVAALLTRLLPPDEVAAREAADRHSLVASLSTHAHDRGLDAVAEVLRRIGRNEPQIENPAARLLEAESMRLAGYRDEADNILSRGMLAYPGDAALRRAWAIAPGQAADWEESLARAKSLREDVALAPEEAVRIALPIELKALQELGRWQDMAPIIEAGRDAILGDPLLFEVAAEALHLGFARQRLRILVNSTGATAGLADAERARIVEDLDFADRNAERLRTAGARILCIGQDATGFMLTGRWGLQPTRTRLGALTFFDLGGFHGDAAATALEIGLAPFLRPENYDIAPAWFGGSMPVHRASGASFYLHRRPGWANGDLSAFLSGLFENVERWRQARSAGRRIYLFVVTRDCSLQRLVDAFQRQLAGDSARLVLLDLREGVHVFEGGPAVAYLHRLPPSGWELNLSLLSPNPDALEFERALVNELLDLATQDTLLAAE